MGANNHTSDDSKIDSGYSPSNSAVVHKKVCDLKPDHRNANKGSKRGNAMIQESLQQYVAVRSILLDKHGAIIAVTL
jgi:hypothetical protein